MNTHSRAFNPRCFAMPQGMLRPRNRSRTQAAPGWMHIQQYLSLCQANTGYPTGCFQKVRPPILDPGCPDSPQAHLLHPLCRHQRYSHTTASSWSPTPALADKHDCRAHASFCCQRHCASCDSRALPWHESRWRGQQCRHTCLAVHTRRPQRVAPCYSHHRECGRRQHAW
jgi:hypothetical protein